MPEEQAFQTLAVAIFGGGFITVLARKAGLPTIVLLFASGIALGPSGLGVVQPESLGPILPAIVALSIGVILFEGGLTLDPRDYLRSPKIIKRLLSLGAIVTWIGGAAAAKLCFGLSWQVSLLAGSLVIVTGPTVIIPLLKRLRLQPRVASILHWEAVLIDAVGVFMAVLCYELVVLEEPTSALLGFAGRVAVGGALGVGGGLALQRLLERRWIPESLTNPFVLAAAVCIFALAECALGDAGLLAVTIAGVIVGRRRSADARQILTFKAELSDLLIGALFILLVGRLDVDAFVDGGAPLAAAVAIVIFVARPLNVWISAIGSDLGAKERAFLSWVAPRGIVAASMASLFSLQLAGDPRFGEEAAALETFVFSVIAATVVLQGLTAREVARRLGVDQPMPSSWLIVGAHRLGRDLARLLAQEGGEAYLLDNNPRSVAAARSEGLVAFEGDARDVDGLREREDFPQVGYLLALTDNAPLNESLARLWKPALGKDRVFAWSEDSAADSERGPSAAANPFAGLPRPAILSEELRNESARLVYSAGEKAAGGAPLLRKSSHGFVPAGERGSGGRMRISLVRQGGYLARALEKGGERAFAAESLDELYRLFCHAASQQQPRLDRAALLSDLRAQETLIPPFLGQGIALLHAYSAGIAERLCIRAAVEPPLPAPGLDEPIRLAYFIVSPAGDPQGHLATLAEIARRHRNPTVAA